MTTVKWKRVCCAVDLSEPSRIAMREAAGVARRDGAELHLVHAVPQIIQAESNVLTSSRGLLEAEAQEGTRALAEFKKEAEGITGSAVRAEVVSGDAAAEVARYAREHGADLLVVGTHGRTGLARIAVGSVAERIVREAPCAVLVVRNCPTLEARAEASDDAEEAKLYRG